MLIVVKKSLTILELLRGQPRFVRRALPSYKILKASLCGPVVLDIFYFLFEVISATQRLRVLRVWSCRELRRSGIEKPEKSNVLCRWNVYW